MFYIRICNGCVDYFDTVSILQIKIQKKSIKFYKVVDIIIVFFFK